MSNLTADEEARFRSKFIATSNGCWIWQGPLDRDGYGSFYLRRRNRRAHRVGWFIQHGEIPEGMVINHVCGNRACVNWQHLESTSASENALRDSRSIGAVNRRKTHCPSGHPYDKTVSYGGKRPQRICSTCEKENKRRMRARWVAEDTLHV